MSCPWHFPTAIKKFHIVTRNGPPVKRACGVLIARIPNESDRHFKCDALYTEVFL